MQHGPVFAVCEGLAGLDEAEFLPIIVAEGHKCFWGLWPSSLCVVTSKLMSTDRNAFVIRLFSGFPLHPSELDDD